MSGTMDQRHGWILGSTNIDEDLHYSSYFLRAATGQFGPSVTNYSRLVSVYHGRNEHYFVREDEARSIATKAIERVLAGSIEYEATFSNLRRHITGLEKLASSFERRPPFPDATEAANFYQQHDALLRPLYKEARTLEVLDRGKPWLTSYLRNYLGQLMHDDPQGEAVTRSFLQLAALTDARERPEVILGLERYNHLLAEALTIVSGSAEYDEIFELPGMAYQLFPPELLTQLRELEQQVGFLDYHGYVRRTVPNFDEFLVRFLADLLRAKDGGTGTPIYHAGRVRREAELPILDTSHKKLFRVYRIITQLKLRRRLAQLRLFPLLDDFFRISAEITNIRERALRFALPEELVEIVHKAESPLREQLMRRSHGCIAIWTPTSCEIEIGELKVQDWLKVIDWGAPVVSKSSDLCGEPVYPGIVRGRCLLVDRMASLDLANPSYPAGQSVLISESTELDMLDLMRSVAAVVTARGGVTSHAATICRELSIPAVVGVKGITQIASNGDIVEVDGGRGIVRFA